MRPSQEIIVSNILPLASQEALKIQRSFPQLFGHVPVRVAKVVRALGVDLRMKPNLRQRANTEFLKQAGVEKAVIVCRTDIDPLEGRFALAHELGHVVLWTKHPEIARDWTLEHREMFADSFAHQLVIPFSVRKTYGTEFSEINQPEMLVKLAGRLGLTPAALLTFASQARWFVALDNIWLRVKHAANAFTRRDPRLRIITAHYDRSRFFIPTNQSLSRFTGNNDWLISLPIGGIAGRAGSVNLKKIVPGSTPLYQEEEIPATLRAMRLQPSAHDGSPYFIILARITP